MVSATLISRYKKWIPYVLINRFSSSVKFIKLNSLNIQSSVFYLNMYISAIMHMFAMIPTCLYNIDVRKNISISIFIARLK
jgi:hypothetical protein